MYYMCKTQAKVKADAEAEAKGVRTNSLLSTFINAGASTVASTNNNNQSCCIFTGHKCLLPLVVLLPPAPE